MHLIWFSFILLVGNCVVTFAHAEVRHYVVQVQVIAPERKGEYAPALLSMLLTASKAPDEVIDILWSDRLFSQARWIAEVQKQNNNNVMWTITSREREQLLRPIRVPMYKGLWGRRLMVIRGEDQEKFARVKDKRDLAEFVAGQGAHWPDTDILAANGLPVMVGSGPENLYKMLKAKRFDYFPRGIVELPAEARFMSANDLVVEKNLILSYPNPMYFFVNKKNTELAGRLERGWEIILKNGQFEKFFSGDSGVKSALEELKKHNRTIIELDNPELPDETPTNPKYWIMP